MDVSFSAWLPGGELAEYRHVAGQHEMVGPPLVVGGVRYELMEPLKTWRIVADVDSEARPLPTRRTGRPARSSGGGRPVSTPSPCGRHGRSGDG